MIFAILTSLPGTLNLGSRMVVVLNCTRSATKPAILKNTKPPRSPIDSTPPHTPDFFVNRRTTDRCLPPSLSDEHFCLPSLWSNLHQLVVQRRYWIGNGRIIHDVAPTSRHRLSKYRHIGHQLLSWNDS